MGKVEETRQRHILDDIQVSTPPMYSCNILPDLTLIPEQRRIDESRFNMK